MNYKAEKCLDYWAEAVYKGVKGRLSHRVLSAGDWSDFFSHLVLLHGL